MRSEFVCLCGPFPIVAIIRRQICTFVCSPANFSFFVAFRSLAALFIVTPASGSSYRLLLGADVCGGPRCSPQLAAWVFLASPPVVADVEDALLLSMPVFPGSYEIRLESEVTDSLYSADHCFACFSENFVFFI